MTNTDPGLVFYRPSKEEASLVADLEQAAAHHPWSLRQIQEDFENPLAHYWVALYNGSPAGYGVYWGVAEEAQLINLAVSPAFRRQHIGQALLQRLCQDAQERGLFSMVLDVREDNRPAQGLYQKEGFLLVGRRPGFYPDGETALLMEKKWGPRTTRF